jgi:homoserine dehydrogenase
VALDSIYVEGIEHVTIEDIRNAEGLGYKINCWEWRRAPTTASSSASIRRWCRRSSHCRRRRGVQRRGDQSSFAGNLMLEGHGAGGRPTASSVAADICDIAPGLRIDAFGVPAKQLEPYRRARMRAHEGGYYVALELIDRPGEVAAVARILADEKVSIASIVQRARGTQEGAGGRQPRDTAAFILITHDTLESAMRQVLETIVARGHAVAKPRMIRIERL